MIYKARIERKLTEAFAPELLEVVDDSESHRGHGGYIEGGETHFNVHIRAAAFNGLTRIACHRAVMTVLKAELDERVHALALTVEGTQ